MTAAAAVWVHPHAQIVKLDDPHTLMWLCLECGTVYEPGASNEGGDPRELLIPAVLLAGPPLQPVVTAEALWPHLVAESGLTYSERDPDYRARGTQPDVLDRCSKDDVAEALRKLGAHS